MTQRKFMNPQLQFDRLKGAYTSISYNSKSLHTGPISLFSEWYLECSKQPKTETRRDKVRIGGVLCASAHRAWMRERARETFSLSLSLSLSLSVSYIYIYIYIFISGMHRGTAHVQRTPPRVHQPLPPLSLSVLKLPARGSRDTIHERHSLGWLRPGWLKLP